MIAVWLKTSAGLLVRFRTLCLSGGWQAAAAGALWLKCFTRAQRRKRNSLNF